MSTSSDLHSVSSGVGRKARRGTGRRIAHSRDVLTRRALVASDLTCTGLILYLTIILIGADVGIRPAVLGFLLIVPMTAKLLGLYDNDDTKLRHSTLDEVPRIVVVAGVIVATEWILNGAMVTGGVTHNMRVALFVGAAVAITLGRGLTRRLVVRALPAERCMLIGSDSSSAEISSRFDLSHNFKATVVDHMTPPGELEQPIAFAHELAERLDANRIERVIIVPASNADVSIARAINSIGVKVSIVPLITDLMGASWSIDDLVGLTMLGMRRPRLTGSSRVAKRTFDLVVGGLLTILVMPLITIVAIAVKLDTPGPVFFRQRRVGIREQEFTIFKFRSMEDGSHRRRGHLAELNEAEGLFKISGDPRVTRVGHILRKTSLDELPQLFNVIRGEMSLVGPRPLVPEEDMLLSGWARFRYSVLPGMTGPWQLGSAARFSISDMASLDYIYVTNWSLWGDIKMIIRTIVYVFGRHGR